MIIPVAAVLSRYNNDNKPNWALESLPLNRIEPERNQKSICTRGLSVPPFVGRNFSAPDDDDGVILFPGTLKMHAGKLQHFAEYFQLM